MNEYRQCDLYCMGMTSAGDIFYIDSEDYEKVSKHTWVSDKWIDSHNREAKYITATINQKKVRLHRFIMGVIDPAQQVDYINHDPFDNRKNNLRICTNQENNRNKGPTETNNSGVVGVRYERRRNKWLSYITVDYKTIHLGYFSSETEAIAARKKAEQEYFGEYAYTEVTNNHFKIRDYQKKAIFQMDNGCILKGDVGTGKSFTSILYYWTRVCGGFYSDADYKPMTKPRPLYIITTARKRDSGEWLKDMLPFLLSALPENNVYNDEAPVVIDSYNNIKKYSKIYGAFFIFDEQKLSGRGAWVKSFLKIANRNQWILLSASPGEKWEHFMPVFIANGFYKNASDFRNQHIEYNQFVSYPSVKGYHNVGKLIKYRKQILVEMKGYKHTQQIHKNIICDYDKTAEDLILKKRWNPFEQRPIKNASEMCLLLKKVVFGSISRCDEIWDLHSFKHPRIIVFYDYDFELEMLRNMCESSGFVYAEWNGHRHDSIPDTGRWLYLCQYTSAAEAWQTTECSTMIFFNNNYSYSVMVQAAGRIDRLNTPFKELYYYHLTSNSYIDKRVSAALKQKKKFNEMKEFKQYFMED